MKIQYSLFDTLLEPVFVLNSEQRVVYCNETAALICGLSIRKITKSMKFLDLFTFSEPLDILKSLTHVTDPTAYREVNFNTPQGGEGKVQITLQPIFDSMGDKNWIVFVRDVTLEERLQNKYRAELEQKETVIQDLKDAKNQLEHYSQNLEKMILERTAEIQGLNQTMTALLDSLHQGFFIFNAQGKVLEVSSKACEKTIECRPQGKNIWDILKIPEKKIVGFQKWLQTMFMEMLPFEDLAPLGPPTYPHSQDRNISLEYFPLRSTEGVIEGIVVVASDITSLVAAEKQAEHDRDYAKLIINLIQNKNHVGRFIRESQNLLSDLQTALQSPWKKADGDFLFRQLHTLKGGAALFSIQDMAEYCHHAESTLTDFKEVASAEKYKLLQEQSQHIVSSFIKFTEKSTEILGSSATTFERQLEIPISKFQATLNKLGKNTRGPEIAQILLQDFAMEPVDSFFTSYNDIALRLAASQEKLLNPIELITSDIKILPEFYANLFATLVHSFRNSVDHGFELPSEREQNGKPSAGNIKVQVSLLETSDHDSRLLIRIDDDGKGIESAKIREKLAKKNFDTSKESDSEVIQHIFDSQFSTRDQVTSTSGRGVGMDAIKHSAEELGGRCWVKSNYGKGTSLFIEVPYITHFFPQKKKTLIAA